MKIKAIFFSLFIAIASLVNAQSATEIMNKAYNEAKVENKNVFLIFHASWCGWCKKMDKDTFADSLISKIMNHYFISVKFDAESKGDIIFGGKTYKNTNPNGRRSAHQLAYHLLNNRLSYPSYTVLNSDLSIATIIPGYYPPSAFEVMAVFLGGEYDKKYSWEDFQKIYEKEIKPELLKALE